MIRNLEVKIVKPTRIIILGAGFGGLFAALALKHLLPKRASVEVMVVAEENFFQFTPMLPEVVAGDIQPNHILAAVRSILVDRRFVFHQMTAQEVDFEKKSVKLLCARGHCLRVPFDYLVIAVGAGQRMPSSIPARNGRWVFSLKTLADAMLLHNQVIDMFEHAEMLKKTDPQRRRLLTFVVVGGGFAGVETATVIHDMCYTTLFRQYPLVSAERVHIILAHAGPRLLPELPDDLAAYAIDFIRHQDIEIKTDVLASITQEGVIQLGDEKIETRTVVWAAGAVPKPLVESLTLEKDKAGRVMTDEFGKVPNLANVFAIGDCTHQENPETGQPYPPTAQVAIRQARLVAKNIVDSMQEKPLQPFVFSVIGTFVILGHRKAVAMVKGLRIRGFSAWFLSRGLYLLRIQSWSNKIRVAVDWCLDIFLTRDTTRVTLR